MRSILAHGTGRRPAERRDAESARRTPSGRSGAADRQIQAGDRQIQAGDRQIQAGDRQIQAGDRQIQAGDRQI
ncbi:hypothetical protein, partial [Streptomyces bobili]|uniref:hypothetical protein n=1 Tax=Streptomyces bobili TaxID=67280 RepID=UPI003712DE27